MPIQIDPGIYYEVPFNEYREWDAVNQSTLNAIRRSPAHAQFAMNHPQDRADWAVMGEAVHCLVLEPHTFHERFLVCEKVDGRTTEGKQRKHADKVRAGNRIVLYRDVFTQAETIANAVINHPYIKNTLEGTERELSLVWKDNASGVLCKGRADAYCPKRKIVIDLKTTQDALPSVFTRSIFSYGYHRQASFYRYGLVANGLDVHQYVLVVVEKDPPHGVMIYRLIPDLLDGAHLENKRLLKTYAECKTSGVWPSYSSEIVDVSDPAKRELILDLPKNGEETHVR